MGPGGATGSRGGGSSSDSGSGAGESDDESSASAVPSLNLHERPARSTAGRSSVVREGKALEDDEAFWGRCQSAWADASSSDSELSFGSSALNKDDDSADSDIDRSDEEADSAPLQGQEPEEPKRRKRPPLFATAAGRLAAAGRGARRGGRGRGAARAADAGAGASAANAEEEEGATTPPRRRLRRTPLPCARELRASTRQQREMVEARAAAVQEAPAAACGRGRRGRLAGQPRLTQQQRLEEAATTEERNLRELRALREAGLLAKDQGPKVAQRRRYDGPRVRLVSRLATAGEAPALIGSRLGTENFVEFIGCGLPAVLLQPRAASEDVAHEKESRGELQGPEQPAATSAKRPRVRQAAAEVVWIC